MTEFTEEQEAEIQKRVDAAASAERYRSSVMQAYKLALVHLGTLTDQYDDNGVMVRRGVIVPFVYDAFMNEYQMFLAKYFPQQQTTEPTKDDSAKE